MAGRTRACLKRLEEQANTSEEEADERPAEEPEAEAQEAQALQPAAADDVRTGRSRSRSVSRSRSRSVSRSRSRSRDRSPPAAELAAPTVQQEAAQCSWLEARDRGAGRSAAAPATTQDHVPHQPLSDPYQSLAAPAPTQGHVPDWLDQMRATQQRFRQDLLQRMREREQWRRDLDRMQREGVQDAAASRQRQLAWLGYVPHQSLSAPYQSLAAPAPTQSHVPNNQSLYHDAMATDRRILQDAMQSHAQFCQMIDQMQREGVQQAAASRQRQLDFLARIGSNGQAPF